MKRFPFMMSVALAGSCLASDEIQRLSPVPIPSQIPPQCLVASVLKDSPAEKAGVAVKDVLESLNGLVPRDASALPELIAAAPADSEFKVKKSDGMERLVKIHLQANRPRLGAACDLSGWARPGVTAAGNESMTVFSGPYALTVSGIIDKGVLFLRLRMANDSDHSLEAGPELIQATDGSGASLKILSPKDVMCLLYGEKGADLLALKKKRKDTMDIHENNLLSPDAGTENRCDAKVAGRLRSSDSAYTQANAQYVATESLWPATYRPGEVADGLIYLDAPASLPVTLTAHIEGRTMTIRIGLPQASDKQMKRSELGRFFEAQKKGNSVRITLKKGKVFVARMSSYDPTEERAWFDGTSGGLLNSMSASLETIRSAEPLDALPAKPAN